MENNKMLHAIPATFRENDGAPYVRGYDITEGHPSDGGKILFNLIPYNDVNVMANTSINPEKLEAFAGKIVKSLNEYDNLREDNALLIEIVEKTKNVLQGVSFMLGNYKEGTMGKRLSNEAQELLNNIKNDKHENKNKTIG